MKIGEAHQTFRLCGYWRTDASIGGAETALSLLASLLSYAHVAELCCPLLSYVAPS
jgi:hypothetical protein